MDFFERQEQAHRNTKLLVVYFITGVTLLVLTIYLAVMLVFGGIGSYHGLHPAWWDSKIFFLVTVGTLTVIAGGALTKTAELSRGGSAVAEMLGGRLVNSNTTDPDERKLLNVVEEMALASGVPVPQVYVLDSEQAINAFAAGHSTSDAAVTVTRGGMKLLKRDELQGVIGHEFSHILNGDMRLNLRLMGFIFGILCLAVIGRTLLQVRGRSGRDRNPLPLIGLVLLLVGSVGVFFGRLIQAAVSRQREFLADASSVQFTRNPDGLAGALRKIGGLEYGSKLEAAHADEASHMFFGNGVREPLFGLLATHPPLDARIRAIDPAWDGKFTAVAAAEEAGVDLDTHQDARQRVPTGTGPHTPLPFPFPFPFPGRADLPVGLDARQRVPTIAGLAPPIIAAQTVLPSLGSPTSSHLRYAMTLRNSFPPAVQNAARDPLGAAALIYGLLLSAEPEIRSRQLQLLTECAGEAVRRETERMLPEVESVVTQAKLPLIDFALPALRQFSPSQYRQFADAIHQLVECDGEIDLFEYVVQKIVLRHLDPHFNGARKPVIQYYALRPLAADCAVLLSAMAHVGTDDPAQAEAAFRQAAPTLSAQAQAPLPFIPAEQCDLAEVDKTLNRLSQAVPQIKKNVLNACAQVLAADNVIQETEAELLRAVADTLDCPIPPFVQPPDPGRSS